ncbi:hypothetical protein GCM10027035_45640 [Emticicia sediminis]
MKKNSEKRLLLLIRWVDGDTFTLSDGRVVTQPAKGATNGAGLKPTAIECKTTICVPYEVKRVKSK